MRHVDRTSGPLRALQRAELRECIDIAAGADDQVEVRFEKMRGGLDEGAIDHLAEQSCLLFSESPYTLEHGLEQPDRA